MVGLPGARTVPFVVPKEDVLEARLNACQRNDRKARRRLDHRIRRSLHREAHTIPGVQCPPLNHDFLRSRWRWVPGGLCENQRARGVEEGRDQDVLALVSGRVLAELAAVAELEALDQLLEVRVLAPPARGPEVSEDLPAGQIGIEG